MIKPEEIKKARKKMGLSQKELAERIGYKSTAIIRKAEKGELSGDKLEKILSILGLYKKPGNYIVYTDGGCEFNPGGRGGYGIVLINKDTGEYSEHNGGVISSTNNRMEILAVIKALELIPDNSSIILFSDSQYVINTLKGFYEKKKNLDLWAELDNAARTKTIKPVWVRGHEGNRHNETCDRLAVEGYTYKATEADPGYKTVSSGNLSHSPEKAPKSQNKGAMSVIINVPKEPEPCIADASEFARKMSIQQKCADAIDAFYSSNQRSFKAYKNLKTYGLDFWSSQNLEDLSEMFPKESLLIKEYFDANRDIAAVLRWKGRGLTLYDAIRKVLVDAEIRQNCI